MPDTPYDDEELPGLEPAEPEYLPGLEPDHEPPPAKEFEIPEVQDVVPTTYDGLTNAQLDEWFDKEYGGTERFFEEYRSELDLLRGAVEPKIALYDRDPDLIATLAALEAQLGGPIEMLVDEDAHRDWHRLGPELKARFRRYVDSKVETTTPPGMDWWIMLSAVGMVVVGLMFWFGTGGSDDATAGSSVSTSSTAAAGDTSQPTAASTSSSNSTTTTEAPVPTLGLGEDARGDVGGSGTTSDDEVAAAATDITQTSYELDNLGRHVMTMKVVEGGQALAEGEGVKWYLPRFILDTPQGEFTITLGTAGDPRVFDPNFEMVEGAIVEVEWVESNCFRMTASIIGLGEAATSMRTELTVRLTDDSDLEDDAVFAP